MPQAVKSLAHKDWPYEGTPHEWRGFVKRAKTLHIPDPAVFEPYPEYKLRQSSVDVSAAYTKTMSDILRRAFDD